MESVLMSKFILMEAEMGGGAAECGSACARARTRLAYILRQYVTEANGRGGGVGAKTED